jgi:hypothetical protein
MHTNKDKFREHEPFIQFNINIHIIIIIIIIITTIIAVLEYQWRHILKTRQLGKPIWANKFDLREMRCEESRERKLS